MFRNPIHNAYLLLVATLAWLFWPQLLGTQALAFRDAAHFYTPLYEYVAARQQEQWLPLWNPCDLTGMPLLGENSTALLYPPRALIYFFVSSASTALSWYVVLHLLFAGFAAHRLAAFASVSPLGQSLAILAYPLAGPIFFLIYNPPFLASAAWLPLLLMAHLQVARRDANVSVKRAIAIIALATAMMIAAGDPQTALHTWLLTGAACVVSVFIKPSERDRALWCFGRLGSGGLLGVGLVAPQVVASIDWTRFSDRMSSHASDNLQFNVKLFHWLELISPFSSGQIFPVHTRVTQLIYPGERDWNVTLYGGAAVMLLSAMTLGYLKVATVRRWWLWVMAGLLLAHPTLNHWLVDWLPGYRLFRYPAKWLPFASLGLVMLAAHRAEAWSNGKRTAKQSWLIVAAGTGGAALAVSFAWFNLALSEPKLLVSVNRIWGPFDSDTAWTLLLFSSVHLVSVTVGLALGWRYRSAIALLVLLSLDLGMAAAPQLCVVDQDDLRTIRQQMVFNGDKETWSSKPAHDGRSIRTLAGSGTPGRWSVSSSDLRPLENYASEQASYLGRWHLADHRQKFNSPVTIRPQRIDQFWRPIHSIHRNLSPAERIDAWLATYQWLGINEEWIVAPSIIRANATDTLDVLRIVKRKSLSDKDLLFQWSDQWRCIAPVRWVEPSRYDQRLNEVTSGTIDAQKPIVEVPISIDNDVSSTIRSDADTSITSVERLPERWTIHVHTAKPGWLTFKTFQDDHWFATIRPLASSQTTADKRLALYRTDYLFMGAKIDPGNWEIKFVYRPWWLVPSIAIAITSWVAAGYFMLNFSAVRFCPNTQSHHH